MWCEKKSMVGYHERMLAATVGMRRRPILLNLLMLPIAVFKDDIVFSQDFIKTCVQYSHARIRVVRIPQLPTHNSRGHLRDLSEGLTLMDESRLWFWHKAKFIPSMPIRKCRHQKNKHHLQRPTFLIRMQPPHVLRE
jgi:hypothetical protein